MVATDGIRVSPKSHIVVKLPKGPVKMRLGFSEVADADQYLGQALVGAMTSDPMNFHNMRVAFYFASRELNKGIRNVKEAGKLLEGVELEFISEFLTVALREGGILPEIDEEEEDPEEIAEGEE